MIIFLIILLFLILFKIKYNKDGFDALGKEETTCIKGIFILIIFFSHFNSYTNGVLKSGYFNNIYLTFFTYLSQLMVVPFFFYSGYSICHSIDNKKNYIKKFPKNRILKVLLQFDLAILLYLILNIIIRQYYSLKTILLSFVGWNSIGNSNWFVFSLICLYVITYFVFLIFKSKVNLKSVLTVTLFTILLILLLRIKKESWWYDILLTYPFGMFIYLYKERIFIFLKKNYIPSLLIILAVFILFRVLYCNFIMYELLACIFSLLLLIITFKFKIYNKMLIFLGNISFEIYILQRIPDIIFSKQIPSQPFIYCIISLFFTICLSIVFNKLFKKISVKLFS